jgi:hypothetical protein
MARGALTPQQIVRSGLSPAYTAGDAVNGHEFVNEGDVYLHVKNGGASPINVTIPTPGTVDGLAIADLVVAVPAAEERKIGDIPTNVYNQTGGKVYVDLSASASVTLGVFKL